MSWLTDLFILKKLRDENNERATNRLRTRYEIDKSISESARKKNARELKSFNENQIREKIISRSKEALKNEYSIFAETYFDKARMYLKNEETHNFILLLNELLLRRDFCTGSQGSFIPNAMFDSQSYLYEKLFDIENVKKWLPVLESEQLSLHMYGCLIDEEVLDGTKTVYSYFLDNSDTYKIIFDIIVELTALKSIGTTLNWKMNKNQTYNTFQKNPLSNFPSIDEILKDYIYSFFYNEFKFSYELESSNVDEAMMDFLKINFPPNIIIECDEFDSIIFSFDYAELFSTLIKRAKNKKRSWENWLKEIHNSQVAYQDGYMDKPSNMISLKTLTETYFNFNIYDLRAILDYSCDNELMQEIIAALENCLYLGGNEWTLVDNSILNLDLDKFILVHNFIEEENNAFLIKKEAYTNLSTLINCIRK